jgi:hypothetical protein
MLVRRTQLILVALSAMTLFLGVKEVEAAGGYAPCMVAPVFVNPSISPAVFTRGEILAPTIVRTDSQKWGIVLPDFETPVLVQAVITQPKYDGCAEQAGRRLLEARAVETTFAGKVTSSPISTAAARIMKGADICCGTAVGK